MDGGRGDALAYQEKASLCFRVLVPNNWFRDLGGFKKESGIDVKTVYSWCPGHLVHISSDCPFLVSYSGGTSCHQKNHVFVKEVPVQSAEGQGEQFSNLQCRLESNSGTGTVCVFLIT